MNRYVELCLRSIDAFRARRFDQRMYETLRRGQDHWGRHGVDGGQCTDRSVIILDGCLVLGMVLEETMRRHVAMDHELSMPMVLALMHVLGRDDRQKADGYAQHAHDKSGHAHT